MSKVGRNDPCPCGSGKKYKKCCGKTKTHTFSATVLKGANQANPLLNRLQSIKESALNLKGQELDQETLDDFKNKVSKATGELTDTLDKMKDNSENSS